MKKQKYAKFGFNNNHDFDDKRYCIEYGFGYIDEENKIAYEKVDENEWCSTCLVTGMVVTYGKTRKECVEKANNLLDKLKSKRDSDEIKKYIEEYEKLKGEN